MAVSTKRLVFCFDGTWNRLDAPNPTNVVITAQSITPVAPTGETQIIHYDPGVGTGRQDKLSGGVFGEGLIDKIVDAYTFLIFNYRPGDELYIFGFSRGAFTARAFVGFLRSCGIIQRRHAGRIADAVALYEAREINSDHNTQELLSFRAACSPEVCVDMAEDAWRVANCPGYATGSGAVIRVRYLGVWDTVGALGIPDDVPFAEFLNRHRKFYDVELSPIVASARHAVAIDETRRSFKPTLWPNFEALNGSLGFAGTASDAPYQQKWFPGVHGSVGGGGDIRGLSDRALDWVLSGARSAGLAVDTDPQSPLFALAPDDLAPLSNMKSVEQTITTVAMSLLPTAHRADGPNRIEDVSESAIRRWNQPAGSLPEGVAYRPPTLAGIASAMKADAAGRQPQSRLGAVATGVGPIAGSYYRVVYGDTLGKLAHALYGSASRATDILSANRTTVSEADRIYVGQIIYLPAV